MIVERCPICAAKVEVALDADAIEKIGNALALRGRFDDLEIADESRADVALRFMNFDGASRFGENDCRGEAGWSRACNSDWR